MRAPSSHRKGIIKQLPALPKDAAVIEEQDREDDEAPNLSSGPMPCVVSSELLLTPCSRRYRIHSPGLSNPR